MEIQALTKEYGEKRVFSDFSLHIGEGEILCVLGESGGGKTTLLNILAGLTPYRGKLTGVPDRVSYIFQEPRLLPNLTVRQNLAYAGGRGEDIGKWLERTQLTHCADRRPAELSGGEKQRASFARAFLNPCKLLLMDEPFSSLDTALKIRLAEAFAGLWKQSEEERTAVFVTHDLEEALMLADRVVVLRGGRIAADERVPRTQFPSPYGAPSSLREKLLSVLLGKDGAETDAGKGERL